MWHVRSVQAETTKRSEEEHGFVSSLVSPGARRGRRGRKTSNKDVRTKKKPGGSTNETHPSGSNRVGMFQVSVHRVFEMSKRVGFRPSFVRYSGCAKDQIATVVVNSSKKKKKKKNRHFASLL